MITSLSSPEGRAHALRSGADEFLAKPVEPLEVVERLRAALARRDQTLGQVPAIPAPAARIRSASVPCGTSSASTSPDS